MSEDAPLSTTGTIESWTIVHRAPAGFPTPLSLCWVTLAEEGLRVLAQWREDGVAPTVGARVELGVAGESIVAQPVEDAVV